MKIFRTIILTVFLTLAGSIYFIGMTTPGLKCVIDIASQIAPGKLQIGQIEGNLLSEFTLKNISYSDLEQQITVNGFHFSWNPLHLLLRKIVINDLSLNHVRVTFQEKNTSSGDFNWHEFAWLKKLVIQRVNIQDLLVNGSFHGYPIQSTANINFEHGQLNIHHTQISLGDLTATLEGSLKEIWNIHWQVHAPKIETLIPSVSGALFSKGTLTGNKFNPIINAEISGTHLSYLQQSVQTISGHLLLNLDTDRESTAKIILYNTKIYQYNLEKLELSLISHPQKDKLITNLFLFVNNNQNQITGTLNLPKHKNNFTLSQPFESFLNLRFNDLRSLVPPTPYAKHVKGMLTGRTTISGTLNHPKISSELTLQNGHIKVTKLGLKLDQINANANYNNNNQIKLNGHFQSGDGSISLDGNIDLKQFALLLTVKGNNFLAANTKQYKITLSPDLTLSLNPKEIFLKGKIFVPYTNITANELGDTITLPNDVVIVGKPQSNSNLPDNLSMQIHLTLGKDIHLTYEGLHAKLGGNLRLLQNPGSLPLVSGELYTVNGTYRAYGQTLLIQKGGRLIYTGNPLSNPGLDIKAVKRFRRGTVASTSMFTKDMEPSYIGSDRITVGVQLTGTLNQPMVGLFSSPAGLSQGDILSYLLFGYPQSEISNTKSLALLNAAASTLNVGGANVNKMTKKLEKYLGHVEFNAESTETIDPKSNSVTSSTTLGVSKKLARNLYLHYSVGNGIDLMYGFEYD